MSAGKNPLDTQSAILRGFFAAARTQATPQGKETHTKGEDTS